jgi:hypothetical protein
MNTANDAMQQQSLQNLSRCTGQAYKPLTEGLKFDTGKPRYDLLVWPHVEDIAKVMTMGAAKYAPGNWVHVEGGKDRYFAAAMRHLLAYRAGERADAESGLPHLAHAATNMMFLSYLSTLEAPCNPTDKS